MDAEHCAEDNAVPISAPAAAGASSHLMLDCPRFHGCNAAFCPMGQVSGEGGGAHMAGEPVCFYLRELAKPGGQQRIAPFLTSAQREAVASVAASIMQTGGEMARQLSRSATSGSRIDAAARLGQRLRDAQRTPMLRAA